MYEYEKLKREWLFTDDGQREFLRWRDVVRGLLRKSGAFRVQEAMRAMGSGGSWEMLATIDRMEELGEIVRVNVVDGGPAQHRVYSIRPEN